jgi:hypothetical protein
MKILLFNLSLLVAGAALCHAADTKEPPMKNHLVVKTANGAYIDNIPPLKWGEHKDCSYSGAVSTILNALGKNATYEQIAGLCGSAYHLSACYGWDPGSTLVNTSYHFLKIDCDRNATRAFGVDYRTLGEQDKETYGEHARKSIDAGIPVLILGAMRHPEWDILTGYEKDGGEFKYFGRSYFDFGAAENELRTDNRYMLATNFPGEYPGVFFRLLDRVCEPTPPKDALKISLQTCLEMFKPNNDAKFGYDAYEFLIESLNKDEYISTFSNKSDTFAVHIMLSLLLDERRAAHIHLSQGADLLAGENKTKLTIVANLYKEMHDTLSAVLPYEKWRKNEFELTPEFRRQTADALQKMSGLEKQARVVVADILANWDGITW